MYYILHGEDEFTRTEHVNALRVALGDPQFADLNRVTFDGRKVTPGELIHACDAVPFLTEKRLVIVDGMLARLEPRHRVGSDESGEDGEGDINPDLASRLKDYLPRLPASTELVFVESKALAKNNPILKLAAADKKNAQVVEFPLPEMKELPGWVERRVKAKGGVIETRAAQDLAVQVGADLRLLDNEIEKLLVYRGGALIGAEDVRMLVASVHEANIFELVNAIGARQTSVAMRLLHEHLDRNAAPLYLLTMIVRQFRMLLQIKDLAARGLNPAAIREQLRLHPFVVDKVSKQAANFSLPQLEAIYGQLLDTDLAIKTGRNDPVVALDLLVVGLTQR